MDDTLSVSKGQLIQDMRELGLAEGQTVMLHASVKSIGDVTGGPQTILDAMFEILTSSGTLIMLVDFRVRWEWLIAICLMQRI